MVQSCENCKHIELPPTSEPCCRCKLAFPSSAKEYDSAPLLWESSKETVNHPLHYKTSAYECIDVMVDALGVDAVMDFCTCNAFKYIYRYKRKNGIEDIKKAVWYLTKYLELAEGGNTK